MLKITGKLCAVLICSMMLVGGLDVFALSAPTADGPAGRSVESAGSTSPRATKTFVTTTFEDWSRNTTSNLTAYNESGGELRLTGYESFTMTTPATTATDLDV